MTPTPVPAAGSEPVAYTGDLLVGVLVSLLVALVIMLVAIAIARFARLATLRALGHTRADASVQLLLGRAAFIAIMVLGALAALGALGVPWPTVVAVAGVLGLAASLALQDVLKSFVAGVYLLVERPFRIGELIKIKEYTGRVETIKIRTTILRTDEGEAVVVPNAALFAEILLNRGVQPPVPPKVDDAEPERL